MNLELLWSYIGALFAAVIIQFKLVRVQLIVMILGLLYYGIILLAHWKIYRRNMYG